MKHALALLMTAALVPAGMAAPAAAPSADLGQNAALRYWTAFALMSAPTAEQDKIIGNWKTAAMDDKTVQLIQQNRNALDYLQLASAVKPCDWGIVPAGAETLLPHLAKARQLARLACLRARYRFSQGNHVDGVRDVCAVLTLASHVDSGESRTLISLLVKCAIQNAAIDAVAAHLPALDAKALQMLAECLDALPPHQDFAGSMRAERQDFVGGFLHTVRSGDLAATQKLLDMLRDPELKVPADWLPAGKATPEITQQLTRQLEEFDASIARITDAADLPPREFEGRTATEAKKLTEMRNPFGILMATTCYARARNISAKAETLMLMLRAAAAGVLEGPEKLKDFKDPYGSGPFEYRALQSGFELKSVLLYEGNPVTLTAGGRSIQ